MMCVEHKQQKEEIMKEIPLIARPRKVDGENKDETICSFCKKAQKLLQVQLLKGGTRC